MRKRGTAGQVSGKQTYAFSTPYEKPPPQSINRWGGTYSPRRAAALHRRKRPVGVSWRRDETSIRINGPWDSLSRAVAKTGQTMDFLLTEQRAEPAAKRGLTKALRRPGVPEKIPSDGSAANEAAIKS